MPRRRVASPASPLLAFAAGTVLLIGAGAALLSAYLLPYEGLEDLGRVVLAMLLAALAMLPFALALLLARRREVPRWLRAGSAVGLALGAVPLVALLGARTGLL